MKEYHPHKRHNIYTRKLNTGETHIKGEAYPLLSFLQLSKCKYEGMGTHYGFSYRFVA
jgi:hypothetical protein